MFIIYSNIKIKLHEAIEEDALQIINDISDT